MSTTPQPHPIRATRDARNQPSEADDALCWLLAAAAPPRHVRDGSRELRGEADAAAAFRAAVRQARRPAGSPSRRRVRRGGTLLAVKAAIAVAGLSGAGVALAAATGNLPAQIGGGKPQVPAVSSPSAAGTGVVQGSRLIAPPSPELRGLCEAYASGSASNPGMALGSPAFTRLVAAAGGGDKVPAYCAAVLAAPAPGHPAAHGAASSAGKRAGQSAKHPTSHPTPHASSGPAADPGADSQGNSGSGRSSTASPDTGSSSTASPGTAGSSTGGAEDGQGSNSAGPEQAGSPSGKPSMHS